MRSLTAIWLVLVPETLHAVAALLAVQIKKTQ